MKRRRLAGALALMLTVIGLSPTNAAKDPWLTGPFSGCVNEPINSADWALVADPHGDFTLQAGSTLPTGLTLSLAGVISGTPTAIYSGTFTVLNDAPSHKAYPSKTFTATITNCPHTVTFDGNGSTGGATIAQTASSTTNLTANGFTKTGYTFAGWNTIALGGGTSYADQASYSFASDLTLYAQWTLVMQPPSGGGGGSTIPVPTHTVTFDGNGSTGGATATQTASSNNNLIANGFTRIGYTFAGWNTSALGVGTSYADQASYSFSADLTLYAQWNLTPIAVSSTNPLIVKMLAGESKNFIINIVNSVGKIVEVKVVVPKGIVPLAATLRITPVVDDVALSKGIVSLSVEILDVFGAPFTQLNDSILLNFKKEISDLVVAKSEDGFIWLPIPQLDGKVLPEGLNDGYYIDDLGNIVILSKHLTIFALRLPQKKEISITKLKNSIDVNSELILTASGGEGDGEVVYSTGTPKNCSVTKNGLVKGIEVGDCEITATKGGGLIYLHKSSSKIKINITEQKVETPTKSTNKIIIRDTANSTIKKISINLGKKYSNKTIIIMLLKPGAKKYVYLTKRTLTNSGTTTTNINLVKNTYIKIKFQDITILTYKYTKGVK